MKSFFSSSNLRLGVLTLAAFSVLGAGTDAQASGGVEAIDPSHYTCGDLQAHLKSAGSLWLRSDFLGLPYTTVTQCWGDQIAHPTYPRTRDMSQCFLGYVCHSRPNNDGGGA